LATEIERAVVLFSGGQDSTTSLAWALATFPAVETVAFDYGQRHAVELACAERVLARIQDINASWAGRLGEHHRVEMPALARLSETALTRELAIDVPASGLPNTFVPGRNLVFFTFAAIIARRRGARHLVGGMCETDFSGYPDCRDDTLKSLQVTLNLGMDARFVIHTPLMWREKRQTWQLAAELGGDALIDLIREETHTCYLGERGARHGWGHGCGDCPACVLRRRGYESFTSQAQRIG
jgi:7-cyano-7-deazaguanine synthase